MSIKLGTIVVDLTANTVSFSGAMDRAAQMALNSSKQITRSLNFIAAEAAAMATAVTGAFEEAIRHSQNYALEMSRFAEKTGTTTEQFSKLAYSAKIAGVPVDMLKGAMERLARTSGTAQSGQKQATAAYAALGITVKDLQGPLSGSGDLLIAVSKKLEQLGDSTRKTNLEQRLLGRTGSELAPMLTVLGESFDASSEKALKFGVVISGSTAAEARKFQTTMVELESVALGFSLRLLEKVSPAIREFSNSIIEAVTSSNGLKVIGEIGSGIASGIRALGSAFAFLVEHATAVKTVLLTMAGIKLAGMFAPIIAGALASSAGLTGIGLTALKMIGNLTGISALAKVFTPLISSAWATVTAFHALYVEEGLVNAALSAGVVGWINLKTAMMGVGGVATIATAALAVIGFVLNDTMNKAKAASNGAATWRDVWGAALDQIGNKMLTVKYYWDRLTGNMDAEDAGTKKMIQQYGLLGQTLDQVAAAKANAHRGPIDYGNGESTYGHKGHKGYTGDKTDAPVIPLGGSEKVDIVKLKLLELTNAAEGAQAALANAGKNVDFERSANSATEATKIIDDLNVRLGAKGKSLTDEEMATIRVAVATRDNDEAQAKFMDTIEKGTQSILARTNAHEILTAAIGQGAAATRAAQVDSQINEKYANASDTFKNSDEGKAKIAAERIAMTNELAAADANADKQALVGVQQQIDAELRLNSVILKGKDARDEVTLANQQAAITQEFANRGDVSGLDAALEANKQLFELKQKQTDLNRASSMNPVQQYRDEAKAISDAAQAAREAGVAISDMQLQAANKANWDSYLEAINKTTLAVGDAKEGVKVFFSEMTNHAQSAAQQVHDLLEQTFSSLNDMFSRFVQGEKVSFAEFFKGIAGSLAKLSAQKLEQGIAGAIFGKAADPKTQLQVVTNSLLVTSNTLLATIAANTAMSAGGGLGNAITGIGPGTTGDEGSTSSSGGSSGGFGGFLSKAVGTFLPMVLGGGMAVGGDVTAGTTYTVGEMGRETFTPTVNGRITPNNKQNSGGHTFNIDARYSNDPAQTEAAVNRAMQQWAPGTAGSTMKAVNEQKLRRPPSLR